MKKFGLIGKSLGHSFSKTFFGKYFIENDIQATYENFELQEIKEFESLNDLSGANVTIPYKEEIIPFLDELSDEAKAIGAVNVVQFVDGKRIGHNTDAFGFHQSIKPFLTNKHERALILGTGGASKAVAHVLNGLGIDVLYISREPKGAKQFGYDEINENMVKACKLIVNCTPIGTFPNVEECISLPYHAMTDEHLSVDLIYNPTKTKFLEQSELNGASILNGETMLVQQALKAFQIWEK